MKKELYQIIEIPEGVEVNFEDDNLTVKGPEGGSSKEMKMGTLDFKIEGNKITIGHKKATKNEKKRMNTLAAHIRNMIKGVKEKYVYHLKICFSHFPFTVSVEGNVGTIKNFLGEKVPRVFKLPEGVEIKIDKEDVTVTSVNKELAGQAAANFERATKITGRDRRIFQDGIYITNKAGKEI